MMKKKKTSSKKTASSKKPAGKTPKKKAIAKGKAVAKEKPGGKDFTAVFNALRGILTPYEGRLAPRETRSWIFLSGKS